MTDLPIAYGGCRCICHRRAGVRHFMACCGQHSLVQRVEQARSTPTASGLEAAQDGEAEGELLMDAIEARVRERDGDLPTLSWREMRLEGDEGWADLVAAMGIVLANQASSRLRLIEALEKVKIDIRAGMSDAGTIGRLDFVLAALRTDPAGEKSGG